VTLVEALKAADELASAGINVRVIDPFTIKPIDVDTILHSARQTGGRLVIVEDHYPEGMYFCLLSSCQPSLILCPHVLHYGKTDLFLVIAAVVYIDMVQILPPTSKLTAVCTLFGHRQLLICI